MTFLFVTKMFPIILNCNYEIYEKHKFNINKEKTALKPENNSTPTV